MNKKVNFGELIGISLISLLMIWSMRFFESDSSNLLQIAKLGFLGAIFFSALTGLCEVVLRRIR